MRKKHFMFFIFEKKFSCFLKLFEIDKCCIFRVIFIPYKDRTLRSGINGSKITAD